MPESAKPLVSALVVSRNAKEELLQCLKAFFASADVPVEAIVVDNDSSDGSPAAVTDEFPQARPAQWAGVYLQVRPLASTGSLGVDEPALPELPEAQQ